MGPASIVPVKSVDLRRRNVPRGLSCAIDSWTPSRGFPPGMLQEQW
jgi:hypothetical protein